MTAVLLLLDLDRLINSRDACQFHNADPDARPIRQSTLRTWASRGRLTIRGHDGRLNLYRLGDVMRLIAQRDTPNTRTADNVTPDV